MNGFRPEYIEATPQKKERKPDFARTIRCEEFRAAHVRHKWFWGR